MRKPTVLVAGAETPVGDRAARAFDRRGYTVRAMGVDDEAANREGESGVEWLDGGVDRPEDLREALDGCQLVVDCLPPVVSTVGDVDRAKRQTVGRLRRLVEAARSRRIGRYLRISRSCTLGTTAGPLDEDDYYVPGAVDNAEFEAVWHAEAELYRYVRRDFDASILIPGVMVGPSLSSVGGRLVGEIVRERLPFVVDGVVNVVDVRDVAETAVTAARRARAGRRYVLGGTNVDIATLVDRVAEMADVSSPDRTLPTSAIRRAVRWGGGAAEWIQGTNLGVSELDYVLLAEPLAVERAEGELDHQPRTLETTLRETLDALPVDRLRQGSVKPWTKWASLIG